MTFICKQSNPSATTLTTLYTVPASTETVVSVINVCNRSATATTIRIAVRPAGAAIDNAHYIAYDLALPGNEVLEAGRGVTLSTTDVVSVYTNDATVTFQLFGQENAT